MRTHRISNVRRDDRRGFTLLEVLLVLAILGVIAAMVVPQLLGRQRKANISAARLSISQLENTLKLYAAEHAGTFPEGSQDALAVLLQPTDEDGQPMEPYLDKLPTDPWGQVFYYEYPNTKAPQSLNPAVWSSGPDKKNDDGSNDDINNWNDLSV
jgi:general secretion pathway protein G